MNKAVLAAALSKRRVKINGFDPIAGLFGVQKQFVEDVIHRGVRSVAACTSRRAGKTYGCSVICDHFARFGPDYSTIPIVTLTKRTGVKNFFPIFRRWNDEFSLGLDIREREGWIRYPNGNEILIMGTDTADDIEKMRGQAPPCVIADEAQSIRDEYMTRLLQEVLGASLMDYDAPLILTGTPGVVKSGTFYDVVNNIREGSRWNVYHWSFWDNPHLGSDEKKKRFIEEEMEKWGWTEHTPRYRREYCGEWVVDANELPFRIPNHALVDVDTDVDAALRSQNVLGVDLGVTSPTAFVVHSVDPLANRITCNVAYQIKNLRTTTRIMQELEKAITQYEPIETYIDPGAMGQAFVNELEEKGFPVKGVPKTAGYKTMAAETCNGLMASSQLCFVDYPTRELRYHLASTQWDSRKPGNFVKSGDHDHFADAFIYSTMAAQVFIGRTVRSPHESSNAGEAEMSLLRLSRQKGKKKAFWQI